MALSDAALRALRPREKAYKLADASGLHVLVTPAGGRLWRWKYRYQGREKQLTFGSYPEISLAEARGRRDEARRVLRGGADPGAKRPAVDPKKTFETLARGWHGHNEPAWTKRHADDVLGSLERLAFPALGGSHINAIGPPDVLEVLRAIEKKHGHETAHRVRQRISAVFVWSIANGIGETDPAAIVLDALKPVVRGRMPAVTTMAAARDVLARVEAMPAHPSTKLAHRFLALTLVRPDNVNGARWDELDLSSTPTWILSQERMKTKEPHIVPLSPPAIAAIEAMRPLTGRTPYVFPNARFAHRPMSENAMNVALRRAGLDGVHVPHGWRATFSSIMNELHSSDADVIERILAHVPRDKVRAAYNRAQYMSRRRELLEEWAELLLASAAPAADLVRGPRRPTKSDGS